MPHTNLQPEKIPQTLRLLEGVRKRITWLAFARNASRATLHFVLLLSLLCLIDFVVHLPGVLRLVLLCGLLAWYVVRLWKSALRQLVFPVGLEAVARKLEDLNESTQDRLASALHFARVGGEVDKEAGQTLTGGVSGNASEKMIQKLCAEAEAAAVTFRPEQLVQTKPARKSVLRLVAVLALLCVVLGMIDSAYRYAATSRLVFPLSATAWPKWVEMVSDSRLPNRVAFGQKLDVSLKLTRGQWLGTNLGLIRPRVLLQRDGKTLRTELLNQAADGRYVMSVDARFAGADTGTVRLRLVAQAGDDTLDLGEVEVVPRLAVVSAEAKVTPPGYTKLPGQSMPMQGKPVEVVENTSVEMTVRFNKPLADEPLVQTLIASAAGGAFGEQALPDTQTTREATVNASLLNWERTGEMELKAVVSRPVSMRFRLQATDVHGLTGVSTEEFELRVRPDMQPMVAIEQPGRQEYRTAQSVIPLGILAEDDFLPESIGVILRRGAGQVVTTTAKELLTDGKPVLGVKWAEVGGGSAGGGGRLRWRAQDVLDLAALYPGANVQAKQQQGGVALQPGDVIEVVAVLQDAFEHQGRRHDPASSSAVRIVIISQEELSAQVAAELRNAAEALEPLRRQQQAAMSEVKDIARQVAGRKEKQSQRPDPAEQQALERLARKQSDLARQAVTLAQRVSEQTRRLEENTSTDKTLKEVAEESAGLLEEAARQPMRQAAGALDAAGEKSAPEPETDAESKDIDPTEDLAQALEAQQKADQQLAQAAQRLSAVGSLQQSISRLSEMLERQRMLSEQTRQAMRQTLGKSPEQLTREQREELKELAEKQQQEAEASERQLEEMSRQAQQMEQSDPAAAQAMKQSSQAARDAQVSPSQSKAAQATKQNQQSAARAAQNQAELGLENALSKLQEAQKHKLEELAKKLEDLSRQLDLLVRRQGSHNLDNLLTRKFRLAPADGNMEPVLPPGMTREDMEKLYRLAGKNPAEAVAVQGGNLSASQELTERNTRNLSESAGSAQGAADAALLIGQAASRMERAAVMLRQNDLPAAWDPSQVQALDLLQQAQNELKRQQEEAQEQIKRQQRENIRNALVRIRQQQDEVLSETRRIDAVPRDKDGNLSRVERVRATQLGPRQTGLATDVAKVREDLGTLNSVVYVWTAKDIETRMKELAGQLSQPQVDATVQRQQGRVIRQLDAMIENLAIKPPEPKEFEDRQQAGGGEGQGGPPPARLPGEAEMRLLKSLQQAVNEQTVDAQEQQDAKAKQIAATEAGRGQDQVRRVLQELISKASSGKAGLGPEPTADQKVPEEIGQEAAANQELDDDLLGGAASTPTAKADDQEAAQAPPAPDEITKNVGRRMSRSRDRLNVDTDPGPVTQAIQKRILQDLDLLIEQARNQDAQSAQQQQQASGNAQQQPGISPGQGARPNNQGDSGSPVQEDASASDGASNSGIAQGKDAQPPAPSADIRQLAREWGALTPRQRQAIIDGTSDQPVEKYRQLIEDYYRSLAEKATEKP